MNSGNPIICFCKHISKNEIEEAIKKGPGIYVENYFNLAETEFSIEEYEKSKQHYSEFLKFTRINPNDKEEAIFKNKCVDFAIEAKKIPKAKK